MIVKVTKKHLKLSKPKFGQCALSLAFEDAFKISSKCIEAWMTVLVLKDFKGTLLYSAKYPEEIIRFNRHFWDHTLHNTRRNMPKPISFEIGVVRRNMGSYFDKDVIAYLIKKIDSWDLGEYDINWEDLE
tara:strand:- start:7700 stop:8089 length:390 start_codon:yes stop_codon:yes gene_type:complete